MITEKDIQTRTAEILANAGFNVVASEVDEGFFKPAVFVSAYRIRHLLFNSSISFFVSIVITNELNDWR